MAVVLQSHSPHRFPSPLSSNTIGSPMDNDGFQQPSIDIDPFINTPDCNSVALDREGDTEIHQELQEGCVFEVRKKRGREEGDQISLLTVLVTVFKKSLVSCRSEVGVEDKISSSSSSSGMSMKISWPTNVRHVSHVTFDRFNGFLGLPVEFEPEVPRRPPSASTRVFGVSTESMQLSFDSRGNSVPTILLMMQRRLYAEGGLQAEGIFRINPDNAQEEYVREQLNMGVVPDNVDIHCLAGLIKAWFRELPTALLDCIPPEEVMQAQSEEQCTHLVKLLPPTEAALLDWAINLMADVAEMEHLNKMNSRNIAMVFAPNMTKMADPLTALMFAVQVMNFLKTLIERTLKNRVESVVEIAPAYDYLDPSDENGDYGLYSQPITREKDEENEEDQLTDPKQELQYKESDSIGGQDEKENHVEQCLVKDSSKSVKLCSNLTNGEGRYQSKSRRTRIRQSSNSCAMKGSRKLNEFPVILAEMGKETSIISRINPQKERVEAWR